MFAGKRNYVEILNFRHFFKYIVFTSEGEGKVPLDNIAKRAEVYKPKESVIYKMIKEYKELDKFIHKKSEEQFNILVNRLRKDLYK